ncbi:MAG: hypothetical protein M5U01_26435 [Ardenticatenaceae bacterium]|nr:hypothetical protein [Ardenticatenaceae bacterium]HBY93787.1 hypothetical protein [Chloroflexota bacterium]
MTDRKKTDKQPLRESDSAEAIIQGETSPDIQGNPPDPGRTAGQAEGTKEDVERALQGRKGGGQLEKSPRDPGRTPGQAEGTEEDVEKALRQRHEEEAREVF